MEGLTKEYRAYGSADSTTTATKDEEVLSTKSIRDRQLSAILTTLYFVVESGRQQAAKGEGDSVRQAIGIPSEESFCKVANGMISVGLQPNFLHYLTSIVAKLRWDDASSLPLTRVSP